MSSSALGYTQPPMLWFTIWFLVILKIPALYLAYILWWAVKDPPAPASGPSAEELGGGGRGPGPRLRPRRRPLPSRRPGPHGSPLRRPAPVLGAVRSKRPV
jgi:hypothetical protein